MFIYIFFYSLNNSLQHITYIAYIFLLLRSTEVKIVEKSFEFSSFSSYLNIFCYKNHILFSRTEICIDLESSFVKSFFLQISYISFFYLLNNIVIGFGFNI